MHHLITAKLIYGWANTEAKKAIGESTHNTGQLKSRSHHPETRNSFPFSPPPSSMYTSEKGAKNRYYKKASNIQTSTHTHTHSDSFTGTFAFAWTQFSPKEILLRKNIFIANQLILDLHNEDNVEFFLLILRKLKFSIFPHRAREMKHTQRDFIFFLKRVFGFRGCLYSKSPHFSLLQFKNLLHTDLRDLILFISSTSYASRSRISFSFRLLQHSSDSLLASPFPAEHKQKRAKTSSTLLPCLILI